MHLWAGVMNTGVGDVAEAGVVDSAQEASDLKVELVIGSLRPSM